MKARRWIEYWFYTISILIIIGVFNYIVDPHQQYRKSTLYKLAYKDGRELNAGLAKNFDFDSIVLGTSMMENFQLSDLQQILDFKNPIKLTMPGSSIYEQSIMLSTAFKHQKIKQVLIGMDFFSYYGDSHRLKYGESFFPFYLYDDNLFNDYKYLVSSDTLLKSFEALQEKKNKNLYSYDKMYEWYWKNDSKNNLEAIKLKWQNKERFDNKAPDFMKKLAYLKQNFDLNLKPLIKKNQKTKFILLFPPYSILAYKIYQERGYLHEFIDFKIYITKSLENFNNVEIYDFEFATDITYNLNNYYDLYHYKKYVTTWMLNQIKNKNYKVNFTFEKNTKKTFINTVKKYNFNTKYFDINRSTNYIK